MSDEVQQAAVAVQEERRRRALRPLLWMGVVLAALLVAGAAVTLLTRSDTRELVIEIPVGTQARIDAGEDVVLVPPVLRLAAGTRLVVINDDVVDHAIGPLFVPAGRRLELLFPNVATYVGGCSVHPEGEVTIEVV